MTRRRRPRGNMTRRRRKRGNMTAGVESVATSAVLLAVVWVWVWVWLLRWGAIGGVGGVGLLRWGRLGFTMCLWVGVGLS